MRSWALSDGFFQLEKRLELDDELDDDDERVGVDDLLVPQSDLSFARAAILLLFFSVSLVDLAFVGGGVPAGLLPSRRPVVGADTGRVYFVGVILIIDAGLASDCSCFFNLCEQL